MTQKELYQSRSVRMQKNFPYRFIHHSKFRYSILENIMYLRRPGNAADKSTYNNVIIMADTETSKKDASIVYHNHVVAWTISIRAFDYNIVTLYGHTPESLVEVLTKIHEHMEGTKTIFLWHNMAYDWVFIRQYMFAACGHPIKQLNTKSHYPIYIEFANGIIFRDTLIVAQRSLDKWAKDLDVPHKKQKGKWDYAKIRNQNEDFTQDELDYIEGDTLAGVECYDAMMHYLNKNVSSMVWTATGIPREECRKRGKKERAHDKFLQQAPTYEQYLKLTYVYHGGYTHANRHFSNTTINELFFGPGGSVWCFDFASSYPYVMLSEKYPMQAFKPYKDKCKPDEIIRNSDDYAFIFKLILAKVRLKSDDTVMPVLQKSKCVKTMNEVHDNGRILAASYIEIYLNEVDLALIESQYDYELAYCIDVEVAKKDYLPRWFTNYVFELFASKCNLKPKAKIDPVSYALAKAKLNSLYGMLVQKCIREIINENYHTGEFEISEDFNPAEAYEKYLNNRNSIFNYAHGCWVTSYAMRNLFTLGECVGTWLYSDTDSIYGYDWDLKKVEEYNESCKKKLRANGYDCVVVEDHEYWLGVAEHEDKKDEYTEFRYQGAKRYCGRCKEDNELHITVAGVPKIGAACLKNDINNFTVGLIFDGKTTGKTTHTYFYNDIYVDENGNSTGDSIDLSPCDYLLDDIEHWDWEKIFEEEIEVQTYEC